MALYKVCLICEYQRTVIVSAPSLSEAKEKALREDWSYLCKGGEDE